MGWLCRGRPPSRRRAGSWSFHFPVAVGLRSRRAAPTQGTTHWASNCFLRLSPSIMTKGAGWDLFSTTDVGSPKAHRSRDLLLPTPNTPPDYMARTSTGIFLSIVFHSSLPCDRRRVQPNSPSQRTPSKTGMPCHPQSSPLLCPE